MDKLIHFLCCSQINTLIFKLSGLIILLLLMITMPNIHTLWKQQVSVDGRISTGNWEDDNPPAIPIDKSKDPPPTEKDPGGISDSDFTPTPAPTQPVFPGTESPSQTPGELPSPRTTPTPAPTQAPFEPSSTPQSTPTAFPNTPTPTFTPVPSETQLPTASPTQRAGFDLGVSQTDGGVDTGPGEVVTYMITYTNYSTETAYSVHLKDEIPEYTSLNTGASSPGWQATGDPELYTFTIGQLAAGGIGHAILGLTIDPLLPPDLMEITNTVEIYDDGDIGFDLDSKNNLAIEITPIRAAPDLEVILSNNAPNAHPGDMITYALSCFNYGNKASSGVNLTTSLPTHTTFDADGSSPGWVAVGPNGEYSYPHGDLSVGEYRFIIFSVIVDDPFPSDVNSIKLTAQLLDDGSNGIDLNLLNNSASHTTPITTAP